MRTTRRTFLQTTLAASSALVFPLSTANAFDLTPRPETSKRGLLFDPEDLPRMRETIRHPRFSPYWKSISEANLSADNVFLTRELLLNNHVHHMLQARQILERTSFAYAISQDRRQLETAKLALNRILEYERWDYFLEGGKDSIGLQRAPEATIAMSFALEWLNDALEADTKKEIEKQIAEKGAPACWRTLYGMKHPDRVKGWGFDPESDYKFRFDLSRWPIILNSTNLKVIPIAGLGIAGCTLMGKHPQAQRWVDMALQSAQAFAPMFGPDGSYDEGISYWGYTTLHLALVLEVFHRKLNLDERSLINFSGSARHALQMSMPTNKRPGDCVNFGDASVIGDISVAAWIARTRRDAIAQYVATSVGEIKNYYGVIWYDPSVKVTNPGPDLLDTRFSNDWVVSRTGWDAKSTVVALRSGGPANHEHADRNSLVVASRGERLLNDPFKAAYSHTQQHWLLRKTEAHTAVLIGGKGHQYHDGREGTNSSWAEAHIVDYTATTDRLVTTSDATQAYALVNPVVNAVRRTLIFLKPDILFIYDRVILSSDPTSVQVRFQVFNEDSLGIPSIEGKGFLVSRPSASLRGTVISAGPVMLRKDAHDVPADIGVYPFIEAESSSAIDHRIVTVCTMQDAKKSHGSVKGEYKKNAFDIRIEHNGQKRHVQIKTDELLPIVTIG